MFVTQLYTWLTRNEFREKATLTYTLYVRIIRHESKQPLLVVHCMHMWMQLWLHTFEKYTFTSFFMAPKVKKDFLCKISRQMGGMSLYIG